MKLSKKHLSFLTKLYKAFRPLLGPLNVCIYPVPCPMYAREILRQKNILIALFLIFFRLLLCNPITAIVRRLHCHTEK